MSTAKTLSMAASALLLLECAEAAVEEPATHCVAALPCAIVNEGHPYLPHDPELASTAAPLSPPGRGGEVARYFSLDIAGLGFDEAGWAPPEVIAAIATSDRASTVEI